MTDTNLIEEYTSTLKAFADAYANLTGDQTFGIECGSSKGRAKIAQAMHDQSAPDNKIDGYKLNSCFQHKGVWHTLSVQYYVEEQASKIMSLQKENEELKTIVNLGIVIADPISNTQEFQGEECQNIPAMYIERALKALKVKS
ncbi:MAG: hypothetical protein COA43_01225 [Robiginitomaculum sp.]|nr:MAG: hypothetical protein COA43_01225 [Robiginitomaculum sp.]